MNEEDWRFALATLTQSADAPSAANLPETRTAAAAPEALVAVPVLTPAAAERRGAARAGILFAVLVLLLLYVGFKILRELEIIYVSALFAVVLNPVINRITTLKIRGWSPPKALAIVVLFGAAILALVLFFDLGLPPVLRDLRNFLTELPSRIPALTARLKRLPLADKFGLAEMAAKAENFAGALGAYVFSSLPLWLSHIFDIVTAIFLTIYFLLEGGEAYNFFISLIPASRRTRLDGTLKKAELKMSKWLFGQGALMLIIGLASTAVFGMLHVRYYLLLGVMMGIFNFIPVAGALISVSLALIAAALDSWGKMFGVLGFYLVYVNLENALLTPRIMKSSVDLSGLTVLIALLIGTALAGIVGAMVAVPTAALIAVLLDEYAVRHDPAPLAQPPTA